MIFSVWCSVLQRVRPWPDLTVVSEDPPGNLPVGVRGLQWGQRLSGDADELVDWAAAGLLDPGDPGGTSRFQRGWVLAIRLEPAGRLDDLCEGFSGHKPRVSASRAGRPGRCARSRLSGRGCAAGL